MTEKPNDETTKQKPLRTSAFLCAPLRNSQTLKQINTNTMKTNKIFTLLVIALTVAISGWLILDTVEIGYESALPTTIRIEQTEIDMGQLQQDKPQTATFKILNTGEKPLFIKHVESSCGCTVPEWTKKPVKPGKTAEIKVTYDAEYPGRFIKQIKVFCNTEKGVVELRIFGEVNVDSL